MHVATPAGLKNFLKAHAAEDLSSRLSNFNWLWYMATLPRVGEQVRPARW